MADGNKKDKDNNEKKEDNDSFVEGFVDGFATTMVHPFRWGRKFLTGRDDD